MTSRLKSWLLGASASKDAQEERLFLRNSRVVLAERGLNPARIGCPGSEFLSRLARHEVKMDELNGWADHLSSCGECLREFENIKNSPVRVGIKRGVSRFTRKKKQ